MNRPIDTSDRTGIAVMTADVCPRSAPPRVVLADDYDGMRKAMARLLQPMCDVVGCVSDGAELLDTIEQLRAEIVILDLHMPGVNGLQVCEQIKRAAPGVDVIVCTAADDAHLRTLALEAGASAFVSKFRVDDLIAAIQRTGRARVRAPQSMRCVFQGA